MMTGQYLRTDVTGKDFTDIDLSGDSLAHSTITGCKFGRCVGTNFVYAKGKYVNFKNANVTHSTFEKADYDVLQALVGATWEDQQIKAVSDWIIQDDDKVGYWAFCTDVFVQCGCMQKTLSEWERICENEKTIAELKEEQPGVDLELSLKWWRTNVEMIRSCVAGLVAKG